MLFDSLQIITVPIALLGSLVGLIWGITTSGQDYPESHLNRSFGLATATPARRLGGALLDAAIVAVTLFIGWLIWFAIVAPRGQTPGKALVSTYVLREDGTRAGGWFMWGRELLVKALLFSILNVFVGVASMIAGLWCLWDNNKQCGWDKIMSSYVAYSPNVAPMIGGEQTAVGATAAGSRLRELQQLRADGVITPEEYEERRQRLVEHL